MKSFNNRLRKISCFPGLKSFNKFGQLNVITAADYCHIMKIAIFALDDIFDKWIDINCKELCEHFAKFGRMYIMSKKGSFTQKDLEVFEALIIDWCNNFKKIFSSLSTTECKFPKLHSWRYHVIPAIRNYGALNGLSTETYEMLHKKYVKNSYRSSNRKNVMKQLINTVRFLKNSLQNEKIYLLY